MALMMALMTSSDLQDLLIRIYMDSALRAIRVNTANCQIL